jgi:hypothetical protein
MRHDVARRKALTSTPIVVRTSFRERFVEEKR